MTEQRDPREVPGYRPHDCGQGLCKCGERHGCALTAPHAGEHVFRCDYDATPFSAVVEGIGVVGVNAPTPRLMTEQEAQAIRDEAAAQLNREAFGRVSQMAQDLARLTPEQLGQLRELGTRQNAIEGVHVYDMKSAYPAIEGTHTVKFLHGPRVDRRVCEHKRVRYVDEIEATMCADCGATLR